MRSPALCALALLLAAPAAAVDLVGGNRRVEVSIAPDLLVFERSADLDPFDESGLLPPGSYRLEVEADIGSHGTVPFYQISTSSFDLSLSFATPAIPALGPTGYGVLALVHALPAALVAARRLRLFR